MIQLWLDVLMSKQTKKPGETLIGAGAVIALLGVVLFVLAVASGGAGNPVLMFGMIAAGAVLVVLGALQRRAT